LKCILYSFQHKVFQWRFRTRLQSNLIIHWNPYLSFFYLLYMLHSIHWAVVCPHVEAIPLVHFVFILFSHLKWHICRVFL
jgi:hypothetical protein